MISLSENFSIIKSYDTNYNLLYQFTTGNKAVLEIIPKYFFHLFMLIDNVSSSYQKKSILSVEYKSHCKEC